MDKPKELTAQERRKIPRQEMPMQPPAESGRNFSEVATGFTEASAVAEADRCIQCKNPKCVKGCPVEVPIPEFIKALREGQMSESARILKSTNNLPAVCGRVCPQETQCELECILGIKGEPVAIGRLERYVADWQLANEKPRVERAKPTGKRVAIIGTGPAGLTCAADLTKMGH
nr:dihydropyrimidine dehydrogenase [Spirochaetota bacterium]